MQKLLLECVAIMTLLTISTKAQNKYVGAKA